MASPRKLIRPLFLSTLGLVVCTAMTTPLLAQDNTAKSEVKVAKPAPAAEAADVVAPAEMSLQDKLIQAYKEVKSYQAEISIEIKPLNMPEAKPQFYTYEMAYDRDTTSLKIDRPELDVLIHEGKLLMQSEDIQERYFLTDAPKPLSVPALFKTVPYIQQPVPFDLIMLLSESAFPPNVTQLPADAKGNVGLSFSEGSDEFIFRIDPKTNLLSQVEQTLTQERNGRTLKLHFTYDYKVSNVNKPIEAKTFSLALGQAKPVDNFKDLIGDRSNMVGKSPLEGKAAPRFTLSDSNGKQVTLDALEKKHGIVVLDFWASWCGPCRLTLPQLQEVSDWAAKNNLKVGIYTVNQGDAVDKATAVWSDMKLSLPILMDSDGKMSNTYGIQIIPQLLVIKDGKVLSVHMGASPTTGTDLKAQIKALLAEK